MSRIECNVGAMTVNNSAYADNIVLLASSRYAFQELIKIPEVSCVTLDITCNTSLYSESANGHE